MTIALPNGWLSVKQNDCLAHQWLLVPIRVIVLPNADFAEIGHRVRSKLATVSVKMARARCSDAGFVSV